MGARQIKRKITRRKVEVADKFEKMHQDAQAMDLGEVKHPYSSGETTKHNGRQPLKEGEETLRKGFTIEESLYGQMMAKCDRLQITTSKYIRKLIRGDLKIEDTE